MHEPTETAAPFSPVLMTLYAMIAAWFTSFGQAQRGKLLALLTPVQAGMFETIERTLREAMAREARPNPLPAVVAGMQAGEAAAAPLRYAPPGLVSFGPGGVIGGKIPGEAPQGPTPRRAPAGDPSWQRAQDTYVAWCASIAAHEAASGLLPEAGPDLWTELEPHQRNAWYDAAEEASAPRAWENDE